MNDFLLSYDNVTLRPNYSSLKTRALADTSLTFLGRKFKLPVVPANMKDVISKENAKWLSDNDYFYIMHRFDGMTPHFISHANRNDFKFVSVSIGTANYENDLKEAIQFNLKVDYITIDVAHGHHEMMIPTIAFIRENFPEVKIIAGNVATGEGVKFLVENCGVDAVKVGIGGGGICTTRYKTGFHLPTLTSVVEARMALDELTLNTPIIADGGAKHYGDIAKALTFGADMVMSGGWFASCIDSPARIENGKKIYRGSTSYAAKGENRHVEGKTLELESGLSYADRLIEIQQALQSSISYAGGADLNAFNNVDFQRLQFNN